MPAASMSVRWAAARRTPSASNGCWRSAPPPSRSRASMRRSAWTSALPARPRSPSRCWPRSSARCGRAAPAAARRTKRREIRTGRRSTTRRARSSRTRPMPATGASARRICCPRPTSPSWKRPASARSSPPSSTADDLGENDAAARIAQGAADRRRRDQAGGDRPRQPACPDGRRLHRRPGADRRDQRASTRQSPSPPSPNMRRSRPARWWRRSRSSPSPCKPALVDAVAALCAGRDAFAVKPFRPMKVGLDPDRAARRQGQRARQDRASVTEARLARSGSRVTAERRTAA